MSERSGSDDPLDWAAIRARLTRAAEATGKVARPSRRQAIQVLEDRARALAEAPRGAASPERRLEIVTFTLDGERLGLETRYVRAVGRDPIVTPLPSSADFVVGVTNFRGEIAAVFDLRATLGGSRGPAERARILFLGRDAVAFAILADTVDEVVQVAADGLGERPWRPDAEAPDTPSGLTADALNVLDGAALLDEPRFFIDQAPAGLFQVGGRP